jgi:hypothetical protein
MCIKKMSHQSSQKVDPAEKMPKILPFELGGTIGKVTAEEDPDDIRYGVGCSQFL